MKLSIIIINHNTSKLVYDCIESIKKNIFDISYEIILVDNSTNEDNRIQDTDIRKILPTTNYQLLTTPNNGFGAGNNAGAKLAEGEYLWLLNSDTLLIDDSVKKMIGFLDQKKEIGIASPLLYNDLESKNIQPFFFAKFQSLNNLIIRRNRPKIDYKKEEFFETEVVVGASLIIRKSVFDQISGFDENIFMFFEDDDLCYRVIKLGFKVVVYCQAKIIHLQGKSINKNSSRKTMYYTSQTYFWNKHYGFWPTILMRFLRWPYKLIKTNI